MNSKTNTGLLEYAKAQLGLPYWLGTFGQTASPSLYSSNKARMPHYYTATDFPNQYGKRVHDCIGLIKGYLWSDTPASAPVYASNGCPDHSAETMYQACAEKGAIVSLPEVPGTLLFIKDGASMGHVGVYIGGGYAVEAKGHNWGVVLTQVPGRGWTHWGKCPYINYITEDDIMTGKEIAAALNEYYAAQTIPADMLDEYKKAVSAGITDGTNPTQLVPRWQAAIMAYRAKCN